MLKQDYIEQVKKPAQNYYSNCLAFARVFISRISASKEFTSEDLINAYKFDKKNKTPNEPRVWGAVIKKLKDESLITHVGFVRYKGVQGHSKPSSVWKLSKKKKY